MNDVRQFQTIDDKSTGYKGKYYDFMRNKRGLLIEIFDKAMRTIDIVPGLL